MCLHRGTDWVFIYNSVESSTDCLQITIHCFPIPGFNSSVSSQLHEHFLQAPFCFSTWTDLTRNGHWDCNLYAVFLGKQVQRLRTQAAPSLYSLIPWSRVLLEKLTGSQLVKKFPAFYGTRRFITALTSARHLSQSRARSIQSLPPHTIS